MVTGDAGLLKSSSEKVPSSRSPSVAISRLKVVVLTDIPTPYFNEVMRALSLKVDLLCLFCAESAGRGMGWNFEEKLGFPYRVIGGARIRRSADTTDYYISPRIIWRLLRARPDVIISGGYSIPSFYACLYCKMTGAKLIIYSDGTPAYERKLGRLQHMARKILVPRASGSSPRASRLRIVSRNSVAKAAFSWLRTRQILRPCWRSAPAGIGPADPSFAFSVSDDSSPERACNTSSVLSPPRVGRGGPSA